MADYKDLGFEEIPEDLQFEALQEPSTVQDLEDLGIGLAQGATLGGADELIGAAQAAFDVAATEKTIQDLPALYREYQRIQQQKLKEAEERSPYLVGAGELAGSFAVPGVGLAKGGVSTAKLLSPLAAQGALSSEGEIESSPEELAKGAALGATVGAVLPTAARGVSAVGQKALEKAETAISPRLEKLKYLYELGKEGKVLARPEVQKELSDVEKRAASEMASELASKRSELSKEIGSKLEKATAEGADVGNPVADSALELKDLYTKNTAVAKDKDLADILSYAEKETLNPKEAQEVKRKVDKLLGELKGVFSADTSKSKAQESLLKLNEQLKTAIESKVPEYKESLTKFAKFSELGPESEGLLAKRFSEFESPEAAQEALSSQLEKVIKGAGQGSYAGRSKLATIKRLEENLKTLKGQYPEVVTEQLEAIPSKLEKEATKSEALMDYLKASKERFGGLTSPTVLAGEAGALVGAAQKPFKQTAQQLSNIATRVQQIPGAKDIGESLSRAIRDNDVAAKNAALFTLMQRPETRKLLEDSTEESED